MEFSANLVIIFVIMVELAVSLVAGLLYAKNKDAKRKS